MGRRFLLVFLLARLAAPIGSFGSPSPDASMFDSVYVQDGSLVIHLAARAGVTHWLIPNSLPLTAHDVKIGEPIKVPLNTALQIFERHHGVNIAQVTNSSSAIVYNFEFYRDVRSIGGDLEKVTMRGTVSGESNGILTMSLKPLSENGQITNGKANKGDASGKTATAPLQTTQATTRVEEKEKPPSASTALRRPDADTPPEGPSSHLFAKMILAILIGGALIASARFKRRK